MTPDIMDRSNLLRNVAVFLAGSAWVFLLLCLGSFHPTDWPSHAVDRIRRRRTSAGAAGRMSRTTRSSRWGRASSRCMFFTGVVLVLVVCKSRIGDLWMRAIGLLLLAVAFAAAVHHFSPGSADGLPEGRGGVVGIAAAAFLQHYFGTIGTRLVLLTDVPRRPAAGRRRSGPAHARRRRSAAVDDRDGTARRRSSWNFATSAQAPALPSSSPATRR